MQTMSPLDSAFLRLESRDTSLHIAAIGLFDGPAPTYSEIADLVTAKLPLLPRYRQRVREVPLRLGRPVWVDDPRFSLRNHLKHTALPHPGSDTQLDELVSRVMSQQLDRSRPLWDTWIVEGLEGDRWALITKVHHCMADGIAATDLLTTVLDRSPEGEPKIDDPWQAHDEPTVLQLLASAVTTLPHDPGWLVNAVSQALTHPRRTAVTALLRLHGMLNFAELARPATPSSLAGPIGSVRSWSKTQVTLDDVRLIKHAFGGTVNDVVLTAVTRGFREVLLGRGEWPARHAVRTLVPVSVREADERGHLDNRVSAVVAELPVHVSGPVARLRAVRAELDRLKTSGEPQAGELVTGAANYIPPLLLSAGLSGIFRVPQRFIVTVATNVPGPSEPLYAVGRQLRELYPYVPIADQLRLGVAISSYADVLYFGVTADRDSTPDADVLVSGIEDAIRELVKLAEAED